MKLFGATILGAATATSTCGTCWEADADGNCVPESGKVTTICGSNTMKMIIDTCLLEGYDFPNSLVGDDDSSNCRLRTYDADNKLLTFEHGLDECGTTMSVDEVSNQFFFTNELNIPPNTFEEISIFTSPPINWNFNCGYDMNYDITADEITVDSSPQIGEFSGQGQFDVSMSFYTSGNFDEEQTTVQYQVGNQVNFGISFNGGSSITGLRFAPTTCEVVNVDDQDQVYSLWDSSDDSMCSAETPHPVDFNVSVSPNSESQFFGLQYKGFAFDSGDDLNQQLLKCHVKVCAADDVTSPCQTGCFEPETEPTTTTTTTTATTTTTTV